MTSISHEDVRGFNVTMNDSFDVSGVERVGDLNGEREQNVQFHGAISDGMLQSLAFQKFHGNKTYAVMFTNFVNCADVRVVKSRCGASLTTEAFEC